MSMAAADSTPTPSMLLSALWYARQGISVFPCWWPVDGRCACPAGAGCASPAKHPLTPNGLHDASADVDQVRRWWTTWPTANIAVPTGGTFDVVDIDGAHHAWGAFTAEHGQPQHLGIAMSGRPAGGLHLYCAPGGQRTIPSGKRGLPPGVEVKGVGGYVIAPPSLHASGRTYTWVRSIEDGEIRGDVPWPDWYAAVTAAPEPPRAPAAPTAPPAPPLASRAERYGQAVLRRACDAITAAGEGGRWNALALEAAPLVARAIAGSCLTRADGQAALEHAARAAGLTHAEVDRVGELLDRLDRQGITHPIAPPADDTFAPSADDWAGLIPTQAPPAGYPEAVADDADQVERTSWWPRDLAATLAGHDPEPDPAHLWRVDEAALFYPGKVNGLIGESESGKTWLALLAVLQALAEGQHVVYLDFEDTAAGIIARLRAMGAADDQLARLHYIGPDEALHADAMRDLTETLRTATPALVILDGFNAAMTLLGLDLNSNTDATAFSQRLLKPLSRTGACVVYVDHVPKSKEARGKGGIGAQAKRAMTTGCALLVETAAPFGRGMTGRLRLVVDKDRPGKVRAVCGGARYAGEAVLTSGADGLVAVEITAPDLRSPEERGPFRPTYLMEKVSEFLATVPDGASGKAIEETVQGKAKHIRDAVAQLVEEGYVSRQAGQRGAVIHILANPYEREFDMLEED